MQKTSPVRYKEYPLRDVPFGKIFTLTQPSEKLICSGKNPDLWFRGLPNDLIPVSTNYFGQCVHINGDAIYECDEDTPIFLLPNVFPNNRNDHLIVKDLSDLVDTECVIRNGVPWIIVRDPNVTKQYGGIIIVSFATGRFTHLARNTSVQSTEIALTATRQY